LPIEFRYPPETWVGSYGPHDEVLAAGHALLKDTPAADPLLVFLFALFHDSMRLTDGHDPDHGPRAAVLVQELRDHLPPKLTDAQIDTLVYACRNTTDVIRVYAAGLIRGTVQQILPPAHLKWHPTEFANTEILRDVRSL
jgi:hypothetical protein